MAWQRVFKIPLGPSSVLRLPSAFAASDLDPAESPTQTACVRSGPATNGPVWSRPSAIGD
jgi:hypothetical protein